MISRSRSGPTAAAMSIECTTSANSTVTCLYSADRLTCVSPVPHSAQNLAVPPPPPWLGSTSISFHPLLIDVRHIAEPYSETKY
jgi:hypothetical protein